MGKKHRKETRSSRFSTPTTITGNSGFIYCSSSSKKSNLKDDAFDIISPKPSPPPSVFAPLPDYHPMPFWPRPPPSLRPFVPPESTISGTRMSTPGSIRSSAVTTISISSTGSTTPSPPLPSPKLPPKADPQERHSLFYFTDDLVTFTVEGCLFRVHQCFLERGSPRFREMLAFAKEAGMGKTDECAIALPNVAIAAFELLLRFLYFGVREESFSASSEDWVALLSIATSFQFQEVRERALAELESLHLDAVQRIVLAREYDITRWLAPAYIDMCVRERSVVPDEAQRLGATVTAHIAEVREKVLLGMLIEAQKPPFTDSFGKWKLKTPTRDLHHVEQLVDEVFWPDSFPVPRKAS